MTCPNGCLAPGAFCFNGNVLVIDIQIAVADAFGINPAEMVSARRGQKISRPRQVAMYLSRELTPYSFPMIGKYFGNRDHTTIMHGIKVVEKTIADNRQISSKIDGIRQELIHRHTLAQKLVPEPMVEA